MFYRKLFFPLFAAILLVGCSGPMDTKLNGTSMEAYQKSLEKAKESMTSEQKEQLSDALETIFFADIPDSEEAGFFGALAGLANLSQEKIQSTVRAKIHGKTPNQLITEAKKIKKEKTRARITTLESKIAGLQKKKEEAEKSMEPLKGIVISEPKFYFAEEFFSQKPIIDFKIANNTDIPLARIYYHGTLTSPNRTIPWVDDGFNHEIKGGLEPKETKHLKLSPNMFSEWGSKELIEKKDLVVSISVVNAEGVDKKKIAVSFDKSDQKELDELIEKKEQAEKTLSEK
jgi:hypothetical protein